MKYSKINDLSQSSQDIVKYSEINDWSHNSQAIVKFPENDLPCSSQDVEK